MEKNNTISNENVKRKLTTNYYNVLNAIPAPGSGRDCHKYLLKIADYANFARISKQQCFSDIRQKLPSGGRFVPDVEIVKAIDCGYLQSPGTFIHPTIKIPQAEQKVDPHKKFHDLVSSYPNVGEADFFDASPVKINGPIEKHSEIMLDLLYKEDHYLYMGETNTACKLGENLCTVKTWKSRFSKRSPLIEFFIINPFTGLTALTKDGTHETLRGDNCIAQFKYCLLEFDFGETDDQLKYFWHCSLPIAMLVFSGNKSIHALIDIETMINNEGGGMKAWNKIVRQQIFGIAETYGADGQCKNPSRLSRLPGVRRQDTGNYQRIIYLAPGGRRICQ